MARILEIQTKCDRYYFGPYCCILFPEKCPRKTKINTQRSLSPLLSFFSAPAIACTMPQFRGKKCHFLPRAIEARLLLSR